MKARMTWCLAAFLVVMISSLQQASSSDIRLPPSIVKGPFEQPKVYRDDEEVTLECVASGYPKPEYEWLKNGLTLQIPSHMGNINFENEGSITITSLSRFDEGIYQCIAFNQHGKTMSQPATLLRAVLDSYSVIEVTQSPPIEEGQPHTIHCLPTRCFPKPSYSWAISDSAVASEQVPVPLSRRVQIDPKTGHLHFSYVTAADAQEGKLYKCNIYNPFSDLTRGGSYTKLNVNRVSMMPNFAPTYMFSSESPTIALEGQNLTLSCFFSGNPEPNLSWSAQKGTLPSGRFRYSNFNSELTINNIRQSDEGGYVCRASNSQGFQDHIIHVDVQAAPVFRSVETRPHNVNVTDGDNITITCNPYADPPAKITWFMNADKLNDASLPPRFRVSPDGTRLTISNLRRDYSDGSSDIKVIQCNATNTHGAVFGDGYINILKKTVMNIAPEDVQVKSGDSFAIFNCSGESDDSTPVTIKWSRLQNDRYVAVDAIPDRLILAPNGSLIFQTLGNVSDWTPFVGEYKCNVSNGYSSHIQIAKLEAPTEEVIPVPVQKSSFPWWIILVILLIFLLILLLIVCCCCLRRNRGDTYLVDEKERKNGYDPEKEIADSGFHDYIRPEQLVKGSKASLASSKKTVSDEDLSLNEYGDIDAGKFTEDGSFIGDYGDRAYV